LEPEPVWKAKIKKVVPEREPEPGKIKKAVPEPEPATFWNSASLVIMCGWI